MRLSICYQSLRKEYAASPIPVFEYDKPAWRKLCIEKCQPFPSDHGVFYYENTAPGLPREYIVIDSDLANYKKLAILRHELAHYDCYKNACDCCQKANVLLGRCEYHAICKSIIQFLNEDLLSPLLYTMKAVATSLIGSQIFFLSAVQSIRNPIWAEAEEVIGQDFVSWLEARPVLSEKLKAFRVA